MNYLGIKSLRNRILDLLAECVVKRRTILISIYRSRLSVFKYIYKLYLQLALGAIYRIHSYSGERLDTFRLKRLRDLLKYAQSHTTFWMTFFHSQGLDLLEAKGFSYLERLPMMTRSNIRDNPRSYSDENFDNSLVGSTSGSTGEPVFFYFDLPSARNHAVSVHYRLKFLGFPAGMKIVDFMILPPERKIGVGIYVGSIMHDVRSVEERQKLYEFLKQNQPDVFLNWSTHMGQLMDFMKRDGFFYRPKVILVGGNYLSAHLRKEMEFFFGCPVFDNYATSELGVLAQECRMKDGFHINVHNTIIEVVNDGGVSLPGGKVGRILVTHFDRRPMLFIRYDVGDIGYIIDKPCPCGRKTPRVFLEGRGAYFILLPDGRTYSFNQLMKIIEGDFSHLVKKYQLIQETTDKIILRVVPTDAYEDVRAVSLKQAILSALKCTRSIFIDVQKVQHIENLPSGKAQVFISKLKENSTRPY